MKGTSSSGTARLESDRVRLYDQVRTAHLERAHELDAAAIVYRTRRYDFDEELAVGLELIQAGPFAAARIIARSRVVAVEVNEPLYLAALPRTVLVLATLRALSLVTGRRPLIVTYAIENRDPFERKAPRLRTRARRRLEAGLARVVWRAVDRVAFGTSAAQELYRSTLPVSARHEEALIPALPEPCSRCSTREGDNRRVVFLGALSERKGFRLLLEAWPIVRAGDPDARLTIVGKGADELLATEAARGDDTIEFLRDPPRARIHSVLASAQVLTLPSQRTPDWREQVGLPIVEALAHGCSIVTTHESGIATWLVEHGHGVLDAGGTAAQLATAILTQLARARSASEIFASLPNEDGRLAADRWLFAGSTSPHPIETTAP